MPVRPKALESLPACFTLGAIRAAQGWSMDKTTVAPISYAAWDLERFVPFVIGEEVTVEKVSGLFSAKDFDLWRDYVSLKDRRDFEGVRFALVHKFRSPPEPLGEVDQRSQELVHRVFVLLRLVKPTRTRFSAVQVKRIDPRDQTRIEVYRFTHPVQVPLLMPDAELLNTITPEDLRTASHIVSNFLEASATGPPYLRRAIRSYEEGYSDMRDPVMQLIVWVMGIESMAARDAEGVERDELLRNILAIVPPDANVYEHIEGAVLRVGDILSDVFDLRNRFAHGLWV